MTNLSQNATKNGRIDEFNSIITEEIAKRS